VFTYRRTKKQTAAASAASDVGGLGAVAAGIGPGAPLVPYPTLFTVAVSPLPRMG
jgi:hypothetical protein